MFATNTFIVLFALAVPFLVRATVNPTIPGPGAIYNAGSTCLVAWTADTDSTTLWKNMTIQLNTGSNLDMQPVTVVAINLDGTVDGQYTFLCPQVTPNAAIYFYQFSSSSTTDECWTTRFAIASSSGQTTPPTNSTQPDGSTIAWGTGVLVNSSLANSTSTSGAINTAVSSKVSTVVPGSSSVSLPSSILANSTALPASSASDSLTRFDVRVWAVAAAATLALSFVW